MKKHFYQYEGVWVPWSGQPIDVDMGEGGEVDIQSIQFPKNIVDLWTKTELEAKGIFELVDQPPTLADYEYIASVTVGDVAGKPTNIYDVQSLSLSDYKAKRYGELSELRWQKEVGGFLFDFGSPYGVVVLKSDRVMQDMLAKAERGLQRKVEAGEQDPTIEWEVAPNQFIDFSLPVIGAIGDALFDHVQSTFTRKKALVAEINAASTLEEAAVIDINSGW